MRDFEEFNDDTTEGGVSDLIEKRSVCRIDLTKPSIESLMDLNSNGCSPRKYKTTDKGV